MQHESEFRTSLTLLRKQQVSPHEGSTLQEGLDILARDFPHPYAAEIWRALWENPVSFHSVVFAVNQPTRIVNASPNAQRIQLAGDVIF